MQFANGFRYFIPTNLKAVSAALVESVGLGYAYDPKISLGGLETGGGPGDGLGLLVTFGAPGVDNAHPIPMPEPAAWKRAPNGKFWVALPPDGTKLGPDDLRRTRVISGERLTLQGGDDWIVPIC